MSYVENGDGTVTITSETVMPGSVFWRAKFDELSQSVSYVINARDVSDPVAKRLKEARDWCPGA